MYILPSSCLYISYIILLSMKKTNFQHKKILEMIFDDLISRFNLSGILRISEHTQKSLIFDGYGLIHKQIQGGMRK